jgi:hypothetical protein
MTDPDVQEATRWPTGTEYAAAVQQPATSFADPELRAATLTVTPLGLPAMASGQNAIAFHLQGVDRPLAVRCLLHANDDGRIRYNALHRHVESADLPAVVAAKWLDDGIRVDGRWWPVVVMPWVSGTPLHLALEARLGEPQRMAHLAQRWLHIVDVLQRGRFAHGDLQHGNVLLTDDDEFQLVDLDGVWVPAMTVGAPDEYGHPNYQHVNRSATDWGLFVDTFSALVIAVSMVGLAADRSLSRFMTSECLLFDKHDFESPGSTEIWRALAATADAQVRDLAARLHALARVGRPSTVSLREALDASIDPLWPVHSTSGEPVEAGPLPSSGPADFDWWRRGTEASLGSPESVDHVSGDAFLVAPPAAPAAAFASTPHLNTSGPPGTTGSVPAPTLPLRGYIRRPGLAMITGHPVLAGAVGGAVAGFVGSILAGIVQAISFDEQVDGGIFLGVIAGMLGGTIESWSALNLANYQLAGRRFLVGASVGLVAGIVAVLIADIVSRVTLDVDATSNVAVAAFSWTMMAALVGLAVGVLRSPRAGANALAGGALAGLVGGLALGATGVEFERRHLAISGLDLDVVVITTFATTLVGSAIALAVRYARRGSIEVVGGRGHGTMIDFHTAEVSVGGGSGDTVAVAHRDLQPQAICLHVRERHADAISDIAVLLDGAVQPANFAVRPGQVLAFAGAAIRFDLKPGGVVATNSRAGVGQGHRS